MFTSIKNQIKFVINKKIKSTNSYKNQLVNSDNYPTNDWYRKNDERNFEIVNIGSSSALYAFNYKDCGIKGFNWALKPQSMETGFKILKNFFSILGPRGIILIPLGPFSGLTIPSTWTKNNDKQFYGVLDPTLIENYTEASLEMMNPIGANPRKYIRALFKDDLPKDIMQCHECFTKSDFENDAKWWIDLWKDEFNISDLDAPLNERNVIGQKCRIELINEIITFCNERDKIPVIIIPPVHHSLQKYFTENFIKNYISNFIDKLNISSSFVINDLMENKFDKYFKNSFFLDTQGSIRYTSQSYNRIKNIIGNQAQLYCENRCIK